MYLDQFDLNCPPFEETANTAFFHLTDAHRKAMEAALACIRRTHGLLVIVGPPGCGKSMLARQLLQSLYCHERATSFSAPPEGIDDIARHLCRSFGVEVRATDTVADRAQQLATQAVSTDQPDARLVVVIDQAENLSNRNLADIDQICRAAKSAAAPLALVLIGDVKLLEAFNTPALQPLAEALRDTIHLGPLSDAEAADYIEHRVKAAGRRRGRLFSPSALRRIVALAGGQPRRINQICREALDFAARKRALQVTDQIVEACTNPDDIMTIQPIESDQTQPAAAMADRLEAMLERAADQLASMDQAAEKIEQRVDAVMDRAAGRLAELKDASISAQRGAHLPSPVVSEALAGVVQRAEEVHRQLSEDCDRLIEVGEASHERLALLVTSLDAAQSVHEKLEQLSTSVGELVQDAQHATGSQGERLRAMLDEVRTCQAKLTDEIASVRRSHEVAIAQAQAGFSQEITTTHDAARRLKSELTQLVESATRQAQTAREQSMQAEQRIESHRRKLKRMARFEGRCAEHAEQSMHAAESARTELENCLKSAQRVAAQAEMAAQTERRINETATQVAKLAASSASAQKDAQHTFDTAREMLAQIASAEERLRTARDQAGQLDAKLAAAMEQIHRRITVAHQDMEQAGQQHARQIAEQVRDATQALTEHASRVQSQSIAAIEDRIDTATRNADELTVRIDQQVQAATSAITADAARCASNSKEMIDQRLAAAAAQTETLVGRLMERAEASAQTIAEQTSSGESAIKSAFDQHVSEIAARAVETLRRIDEHAQIVTQTISADANRFELAIKATVDDRVNQAAAVADEAVQRIHEQVAQAAQIADSTLAAAGARMEEASRAADQIRPLIEAADKAISQCELATFSLQKETSDARRGAEQINHLIRDVCSLNTTTDDRIRSLNAGLESAQRIQLALSGIIQQATGHESRLDKHLTAAGKVIESLGAQAANVKESCVAFDERAAVARTLHQQLDETTQASQSLDVEMQQRQTQLDTSLHAAAELLERLESEQQTIQANSTVVESMAAATNQLESRVRELQEALADPIKLIDDARAQADELNGISLVVKRVFRGISQASLEANERVKSLRILLAKADQWSASAKQSLTQWVAEANRAQQRLITAVEQAPPPSKTHPLTSLPSLSDRKLERTPSPSLPPAKSPEKSSRLSPSDIQQMLSEARNRAAATV